MIECPNEQTMLKEKKNFFIEEKRSLNLVITNIENRIKVIRRVYSAANIEKKLRAYRKFALNQIDKVNYHSIDLTESFKHLSINIQNDTKFNYLSLYKFLEAI